MKISLRSFCRKKLLIQQKAWSDEKGAPHHTLSRCTAKDRQGAVLYQFWAVSGWFLEWWTKSSWAHKVSNNKWYCWWFRNPAEHMECPCLSHVYHFLLKCPSISSGWQHVHDVYGGPFGVIEKSFARWAINYQSLWPFGVVLRLHEKLHWKRTWTFLFSKRDLTQPKDHEIKV